MKTVTGTWQDGQGNLITFGTLWLKLNQDAVVVGTSQIAPRIIVINLNASGAIPAATTIWCNDELTPTGTFYTLSVLEQGGGIVYGPENFTIAGSSPINLNNIVPISSGGGGGGGGGGGSSSSADSVQSISTTQAVGFASAVNTLILATAGVGGITLTLPSAVGVAGQTIRIVMVDTGAGGVSIATTGGQSISGRSNYSLSNQWQVVDLESTNLNWVITGASG